MAIPVPVPVQPFAASGDSGGVPLGSLPEMVGARVRQLLATGQIGAYNSHFDEAYRVQGLEVRRFQHDGVTVEVRTSTDRSIVEQWEIDIDQWSALTRARSGDTLVAGTTGVAVTGSDGTPALIGRSVGNKPMIQAPTFASDLRTLYIDVAAYTHDEGLLERRLEVFEDHAVRQIIVHRLSPTEPADPGNEVSYDGTTVTTAEDSEWKPIEIALSGTDPEWIAAVPFQYSFEIGFWLRGDATWTVYPGGSTFRVQYASSATGPWVATAPDTETLWVRYRLADGTWSAHQVSGPAAARRWRSVLDVTLPAAQTSSEHIFTQIDTDEYGHIVIVYQGDRDAETNGLQGQRIPVDIPAFLVLSGDPSVTDQQQTSLFVDLVERSGGLFTVGGHQPNLAGWMSDASQADQRLRLDFYGTTLNDPFVSRLVVRRGDVVGDARLQVFAR